MSLESVTADLQALIPPMLRLLDGMTLAARYFAPGRLEGLTRQLHHDGGMLIDELQRLDRWPTELADLAGSLRDAAGALSQALSAIRPHAESPDTIDEFKSLRRASRHAHRAREALYPMSHWLAPVSAFFLPPDRRSDDDVMVCMNAEPRADRGIFHARNATSERGGVSIYVSERCDADRPAPLVLALHGGGGHGRDFLWSWLPAARLHGAIVVCPTATDYTWPIFDEEPDRSRLLTLLDRVRSEWPVDPDRILLTGMSDGGTFTYVLGLAADAPFSHLSAVAASFHPMLAQAAEPARLRQLPIHVVHGRHDGMFPVDMARTASNELTAAGARVSYTELPDLGHAYPVEMSAVLLDWMASVG